MSPFPTLKLTYFDIPGRADAIRTIFRLGRVPFHDERLPRDEFPSLKPALPYGQLPVLTVDGQLIAESQAILRYAGRITGMYPTTDPLAALMVDEVLTAVSYLTETKVVPSIRERDAEKRKQLQEALVDGALRVGLTQIEARLERMAEYDFFKDSSTRVYVHEVVLSTWVDMLRSGRVKHLSAAFLDEFELITHIHNKVAHAVAHAQDPLGPRPASTVSTMSPSRLKLTYWDLRARGDILRLALHIGGFEFEDERVTREQHELRKPTLPHGQIPVLEVDGAVFGQTFALACYAGTISGLYPVHDPLQAARVDEIIARVETIHHSYQASYEERDPDVKRAMRDELLAQNVIRSVLDTLDKRVAEWKKSSPFVLGDQISLADLAIHHIMDFVLSGGLTYVPPTTAQGFPTLAAIHQAVDAHPRVVD